jgi:hypothetical protein
MTEASPLRAAIEAACLIEGCSLRSLTVLSKAADPFRLDTPANHVLGQWVADEIGRAFRPHQRVHIRGLHYAVVTREGGVRKPDGAIYRNTAEDAAWLDHAVKAARWLAYVPFERISDNRNSEPVRYRLQMPTARPVRVASAGVDWLGEAAFELGTLHVARPQPLLLEFTRPQPYAVAIFAEKSSTEDVLNPIARRYGADLYLGTGEASNTRIYEMAKDGAEDGRPLAVATICDCDPSGRQMPVSIGRKLQALRDLYFPELRFEVIPLALTVDQVRDLDLPSTPLKDTEKRADRWKAEFGVEQTEIDALATLRPNDLRRIVERGLAPYFDVTLQSRIERAKSEWRDRAQAVIDEHVDPEELALIAGSVDAIEEEAEERIAAIKEDIAARVAAENGRLQEMIAGIRLPEAALPEVELPERPLGAVLVSADWDWADQTRALKAHKSYGEGEP